MIRSILAVIILVCARLSHCEEATIQYVQGTISVKASKPVAFLVKSFVDTPNAEFLRTKAGPCTPFFILYEGRRILFDYDPTGTIKPENKSYEVNMSDAQLIGAVSNTLVESDNDLKTTTVGNTLIVSEKSLSEKPDWPLNERVVEAMDQQLTMGSAENLLREKYNYANAPEQNIFREADPGEVVSTQGSTLTVRELLVRMLSKTAQATYKTSIAKNWAVIYQVTNGSVERADAPMNFVVTQLVSRR